MGLMYNGEGYRDPVAGEAIARVSREEAGKERYYELMRVLKYIIGKAGFELCGRITLRDKRTGTVHK